MLTDIQNENLKIQKQLDDLDREFQQIKKNIETQRTQMESERNRNSFLKSQLDEKQQQVTQARQGYDTVVNERLSNLQSIHAT